jgi:small subunit ribosomal protein S2
MSKIDFSKLPDKAPEYDLRDLLEAGCHFGHQRSKWNPKMDKFIHTDKEGVNIFDLAKTAQQLQKAYNYFYLLGKQDKKVIMLGTKRQAREVVEEVAQEAGMMYIVSRWLGGFLTNWDQIKKSIKRMRAMEAKFESGEYENYTKFEQAQLKKELTRLQRFFEGIREIQSPPDVIFIVDAVKEDIAVTEATSADIPIVAILDSNGDPDLIDLPIPANDDSLKSVSFIVEEIGKAYKLGKEEK